MNGLFGGENVSVDFGFDESNHGVNWVGDWRSLGFATLVQGNDAELVVISRQHVFGHPETVSKQNLPNLS